MPRISSELMVLAEYLESRPGAERAVFYDESCIVSKLSQYIDAGSQPVPPRPLLDWMAGRCSKPKAIEPNWSGDVNCVERVGATIEEISRRNTAKGVCHALVETIPLGVVKLIAQTPQIPQVPPYLVEGC